MNVAVAASLVVVLSGCDILFQLGDLHSAPVDATPDAGCGSPDEDGDCIADDVDNCPGIYNPSQASDGDSDQLGDVCDPRPTVAGDTRANFFAFNTDADRASWQELFGMWQFEPGSLVHSDATESYAHLVNTAVATNDELTIEAGFTFTAWNPAASVSRLGVWLDMPDPPTLDGHNCYITLYGSSSSENTVYEQERVYQNGNSRSIAILALQPGDQIVFSLRRHRNPDVLQCHVLINGNRLDVMDLTAGGTWPTSGHVGVQAGSTNARLRYVVTYVGP